MTYFKKLVGEQVYLSPRAVSDETVEKFTKWMNDFSVTDYLTASAGLYTLTGEREWIEASAKDSQNRSFDVVTLDGDELIGTVSLKMIEPTHRSAILGIYIGEEKYRSKGFGTEAVNLILEYAFSYLNLHSVQLEVIDVNKRARRCYEKCGFKETGRNRERYYIGGKYYDGIMMDILDREFKGGFIKNKNI